MASPATELDILTAAIMLEARRLDRCTKAPVSEADLQHLAHGMEKLLGRYCAALATSPPASLGSQSNAVAA